MDFLRKIRLDGKESDPNYEPMLWFIRSGKSVLGWSENGKEFVMAFSSPEKAQEYMEISGKGQEVISHNRKGIVEIARGGIDFLIDRPPEGGNCMLFSAQQIVDAYATHLMTNN